MRLSYSKLSTFQQCPKKYHWQYVQYLRVPPTPDLFFGILIHEVLDFMLKNDPIIPSLEELIQYYGKKWNPKIFKGEISAKEYYQEGLNIIKYFYSDWQSGLRDILYTEKFFELFYEGHTIVGKVDRIDKLPTGEIEVVDYKTNRKLPQDDDFKYDLQLAMYKWGVTTLLRGNPEIKMTLQYLRHNKKISPIEITSRENLQKFILDTVREISKTDYKATPSVLCGWCEYLHMCEEGQASLKTKSVKLKTQNNNSKIKAGKLNSNFEQTSLF